MPNLAVTREELEHVLAQSSMTSLITKATLLLETMDGWERDRKARQDAAQRQRDEAARNAKRKREQEAAALRIRREAAKIAREADKIGLKVGTLDPMAQTPSQDRVGEAGADYADVTEE